MTPEAQRIAIAEACGWKFDAPPVFYHDGHWKILPYKDRPLFTFEDSAWAGEPEDPILDIDKVPDYLHDLNAMHEAEKVLTEKQQVWYLQKLTQVRFKQGIGGMIGCMIDKTTFATAAQRAEAFLRTLGKWVEDEKKEATA